MYRSFTRLLLSGFAVLLLAGAAAGQTTASSVEARTAQFVLVLDDSGSMDRTDPDRLAVFAVRSLLSLLDDRDEVSIVRLNAPKEEAPAIEPLGNNRANLLRRLNLGGELAAYLGENTTCRSALEVAKRLLEEAHRPNVAQVVLFLTDGKCTPADQRPDAAAFLQGLASHGEGLPLGLREGTVSHLAEIQKDGAKVIRQLVHEYRALPQEPIEKGAAQGLLKDRQHEL